MPLPGYYHIHLKSARNLVITNQPLQPYEWNKIPVLTGTIVLHNKKKIIILIIFCCCLFLCYTQWSGISQDYNLSSDTTHVVCINFVHVWRDLQFQVNSRWQIFEKLFMVILSIRSEFFPEICWEDK